MIAALIVNILLFAMELYATLDSYRECGWAGLRYYTHLSNVTALLASGVFLLAYFTGNKWLSALSVGARFVATCMLLFTFLVVIFVLTPIDVKSGINPSHYYLGNVTMIHHVIAPILSFVSFVFFEKNTTLTPAFIWIAMGITIVYSIILMTLNIRRILVGPYPFFHVYEQSVLASVGWIVALGVFSYLLDYFVCMIGRK